MDIAEPGVPAALQGLLRVARLARTADVPCLLRTTAEVLSESLGFRTVVFNLYRPEYDDLETVTVLGSEEAREALLGNLSGLDDWTPLLDERFLRRGAFHIPNGAMEWAPDIVTYTPSGDGSDDPDAWHPEDALFIVMRSSANEVLGVLCVDEPASGLRPSDTDLDVLVAAAGHVSAAIEQAQAAHEADRHHKAVEHLLRVSAGLIGGRGTEEVLATVCEGIGEALEFERVAVFLDEEGTGQLHPRAATGWDAVPLAGMTCPDLDQVLHPRHMREGCVLLDRESAHSLTPAHLHGVYESVRNGKGPLAWDHHWLIVPLYDADARLMGVIWAEDPVDRLLPTRQRLQALRLFADQAVSALEAARLVDRLRAQANRDPLTGLPNRRRLDAFLDASLRELDEHGLALLVADLDNFKRVNDHLGHEGGDEALERFARVLESLAGERGLPARMGGEEFALVLPGSGEHEAYVLAARLRRAMAEEFADFAVPITVSAGITATGRHGDTARELLRNADRALYAAKAFGRDRAVVYRPETADDVLAAPDTRDDEQLSAVLLLAETLDMRDDATAKHSATVGRYAEMTARSLGLPPRRVERIRVAGILHDLGKVGVADAILRKAGPLDDSEWAEMRRHPEVGARILANARLLDVSSWVLAHHERIDGLGYPDGLDGARDPARGADPRGGRRLRGDDRRPALRRGDVARPGRPRAAGVHRHPVRLRGRRGVHHRARRGRAGHRAAAGGLGPEGPTPRAAGPLPRAARAAARARPARWR